MRGLLPAMAAAGVVSALAFTMARAQVGTAADPRLFDGRGTDIERGRAIAVGKFTIGHTPEPQVGACFRCHGLDGRGDGAAAFPRLTDQVYKYLYDSLKNYASGVRQSPIMEPIAKALTDQQMRDVSAYYAAQKDAPHGPRPDIAPEVLQFGGTLAAIGSAQRGIQGCSNCHGPEGVGLPPTYPYLAGQHMKYLEAQLLAWKEGRRKGDGLAIMENIAKRMTAEEIHAVSAYYASIRPKAVTPEVHELAAPMEPEPGPTTRVLGR